jgi:hypothetical protein
MVLGASKLWILDSGMQRVHVRGTSQARYSTIWLVWVFPGFLYFVYVILPTKTDVDKLGDVSKNGLIRVCSWESGKIILDFTQRSSFMV